MIPSYICYEVPQLLEQLGCEVAYYELDHDFNPDVSSFSESDIKPDFFLVINYFGICSNKSIISKWCSKQDVFVIEDSTHVMIPEGEIGASDFSLYSPYKHFPVPDGGALVVRNSLLERYPLLKASLQKVKVETVLPAKWVIKKIIQRLLWVSRKHFLSSHGTDPAKAAVQISSLGINHLSLSILGSYTQQHLEEIATIRRSNLNNWHQTLRSLAITTERIQHAGQSHYVIKSENAAEIFKKLNSLGAKPLTWPTLPGSISHISIAFELRRSLILLPIHQGLKSADFLGILRKVSTITFLANRKSDPDMWETLHAKMERKNILQSLAFDRSRKNINESLDRVTLSTTGNVPIGVASVRVKKLGLLKLVTLNRGPLLQKSDLLSMIGALKAIKKLYPVSRGNVLIVVPEIDEGPLIKGLLKYHGWLKLSHPAQHSSRINLNPSIESIRSSFHSKWRNLLKKGEASNLEIRTSSSKEDYDAFLDHYDRFVQKKDFAGISLSILKNYYLECPDELKPLVIFALKDDVLISGVLIARYANEAVYLLGFNQEQGRKDCANYLLLWHSIIQLKTLGVTGFDLGGLDDIQTPNITHFKRQMNGQEYHLAGTFIRVF